MKDQLERLITLLRSLKSNDDYYKSVYADIDLDNIKTFNDLSILPFLYKNEIIDLQKKFPPFGGLMGNNARNADYCFYSPGPICEPGFMSDDFWRISHAMTAAGFSESDIIHNCYSYHLTPGAWMMDAGARKIGATVIPAGTSPMDMHIEAINHYQPTAYCGTPDLLLRLITVFEEKMDEKIPFQKALVSGGALTQNLRDFFNKSNVAVKECYATAEIGLISYEMDGIEGMVVDEDIILEIIDTGSGQQAAFGEIGEVVVTTLRNKYPLIRFGTGDLSALLSEGVNDKFAIIAGWKGRADEATKVKGMFVRPSQIKALIIKNPHLLKARLIVHRVNERDEAILHCEVNSQLLSEDTQSLKENILSDFRSLCYVGSEISLVASGTIPEDDKLIVDLRKH